MLRVRSRPGIITRTSGAAAGFSPLSIPDLAAWYDAADTGSITAVSNAVSQWNDKSGNARHGTQGTATFRPSTGVVTVNGLNAVNFDGGDDFINLPSGLHTLPNGANTVFTVYQSTNSGDATQRIWTGTSGTDRWALQLTTTQLAFFNRNDTLNALTLNATRDTTTRCAITRRDGTSMQLRRDGGAGTSSALALNTTLTSLTLSGNNTSGVRYSGRMCEVLMWARGLTTAEMNQVGLYLSAKWGHAWTTI